MGVGLLHIFHIPPHRDARPQFTESFCCLVDQLLGMRQKQGASATVFGIHHRCHSLSGAGGMIQQGDGLTVIPHGLQRFQRLDLVLFQIQMGTVQLFAALGRKVVLDLLELGMAAEEHVQLILDCVGLNLHLPNCPTVDIPPQVHHAVLFE